MGLRKQLRAFQPNVPRLRRDCVLREESNGWKLLVTEKIEHFRDRRLTVPSKWSVHLCVKGHCLYVVAVGMLRWL